MFDKMKQMMDFKKQADQMKRELEASLIEVSDIPGIRISINGAQKCQALEIDESLLRTKDPIELQGDLLKSINVAIERSQNLAAQKMKQITGLSLPGL